MASMPANFGAILTAMVTPFDARGRVDEEAAVRLMHHLADHGSDGLVVCGTTGESATLDVDEHTDVIRRTIDVAAGRGMGALAAVFAAIDGGREIVSASRNGTNTSRNFAARH